MSDISLEIVSNFINAILSIMFVTSINHEKEKRIISPVIFIILMFSLETIVAGFTTYPVSYVSIAFLQLIIPFIYSVFRFKTIQLLRRIIPVFAFFGSFIISELISSMITASAFRIALTDAVFANGSIQLVHLCVSKTILFLLLSVSFLLYKKTSKTTNNKLIYYLLVILPAFSLLAVLIGGLNFRFEIYYISSVTITSLSTFAIYYLIYKAWQNIKVQNEKELYRGMLKIESKRYEDIKNSSEQIRKIKHDIKNMLIAVKSQIDSNNIEDANIELNYILNNVSVFDSIVNSENRIIDYIINSKLSTLKNRQIKISGSISNIGKIKDIDLSIILGNILDNAIEATEGIKNAVIDLSFFDKNNYHNILCKNTITQPILPQNPELKTSKSKKTNHGFGVKSVKEITANYNGMVDFFEEDNMFCVHIMLPIN